MRLKMFLSMFVVILLISGCTNINSETSRENGQENLNTQPMNDGTDNPQNKQQEVRKDPNKRYYQSDEEGIGTGGNKREIFASEEDREISQLLAKREGINDIQVTTMGDNVIVFLRLKEHTNDTIVNIIEQEIKRTSPDKEVIIYANGLEWD